MADNYLERKMEELRSGKTGKTPAASRHTVKRNQLSYSFKTLRVLIIADGRKFLSQYIDVFRNTGGRVAIFSTIPETDTDLPESHGCRYYAVSDGNMESPFQDLVKAWRDIDVVVLLDAMPDVLRCLSHHVESLPYPNDWGMPILEIGEHEILRHESLDFIPLECHAKDCLHSNEPRILPYLSLPQNRCISRIILQQ